MYRLVTIFSAVVIAVMTPLAVTAQSRGEGVGALLGRTEGPQRIEIKNGRTSPRANIFVENANREVQVEAALDEQGVFNFAFQTDIDSSASLYIYAQDEAGQTARVPFSAPGLDGVILSPTLTVEGDPVEGKPVIIYGFSYPNASIDITVRDISSGDIIARETAVAQSGSGRWESQLQSLDQGAYIAIAQASLGSARSAESVPLTVRVDTTITTKVISVVSKALLIPAAAVVLAPAGISFADLYYYLMRLVLGVRGLMYFPSRKKVRWGVVYDALTKGFISGAIVRLYKEAGGLVETEVTGATGAFSFLPQPGKYTLRVVKPGLAFPSQVVTGKIDGEYSPIYHGQVFEVRDFHSPLTLSIPMDDTARTQRGFVATFRQMIRQYRLVIEVLLLVAGLCTSVIISLIQPVWYNQFVILIYILILIIVVYQHWRTTQLWGSVVDESGKVAPLVSLSLLDSTFNRQVQRRVSDARGRYQFVAPSGTYQIVVTSDNWELVTDGKGYNGGILTVKKHADIVKPTVVVRQKRSYQSSPVAPASPGA